MGQPQARKRHHKGDKPMSAKYRLRKKTKDLDQIHVDMKPQEAVRLLNQVVDFDKPGNAQFYCVHCARYFITDEALQSHFKTKLHKKRLKMLAIEPYSKEEAQRASGMGSYIAPKPVQVNANLTRENFPMPDISQISENFSAL